ncbi:MAG: hypothetical protein EBV57_04335, partial [Betaproteobacteria bacterium]|nr:hypothetical protein [Betaproteobacteria bacterium]
MLSTVLLVASPLASAEHLADTVTVTAPVIDRSLPDIGAARARLDQVPGGTDVVDSERYRAPYIAAGGAIADGAALAQFRGQMNSTENPLIVREKTLAAIPIKDP